MAGSAVAADALLLALAPVAARRAGRVAENAAPARPTVALPARRVTRSSVLALTLVPTGSSSGRLKTVLRIHMFLGLLDPDPLVRGTVRLWICILPFSHEDVERTEILLAK